MSTMQRVCCYFAAYIIVGFVVFGWRYNHPDPPSNHYSVEFERQQTAVFSGMFWPVWLVGTFAVQVTRWP